MSMTGAAGQAEHQGGVSLYRALWRWHFFAGLLVIPFMLNLAVTGSLYLFKDEINDTFFSYRYNVVPKGERLSPADVTEIARHALPNGSVVSYRDPASAERSAIVTVETADGQTLVFVNPYNGVVLDTVGATDEFNYVVKRIHSLAFFGPAANRLVEITGGFAMMLVVSGIYLWWPRQQNGGVVSVRGTPRRRVFWRDLHAVTGAFAGVLIFFLAVTGMPWSGYWGSNVNEWLTSHGLGYPVELWDNVPQSRKVTEDILPKPGWVVERAPVPLSDIAAAQSAKPIGINAAVEIARELGIRPGFDLAIPATEAGVYTAAVYPEDVSGERTIHIDQYSGKPLVDLAFSQYPFLGKAIEWGINVHQGQEWGRLNQLLMLATCLAIIVSCVSAVMMWWKRRPSGRLGVPPMPPQRSVYFGLWVIVAVFAVLFPLSGLAVLVMVAFDQVVVRFVPPLRRVFA
ncbi:hypothetical protein ASE04_01720 [Rhizobium sp. Root708]|uniref:PepSY-associated TM helix domain-containing protein n=1 Tax=Rhizobium sp. Root708 TaxID=1736592 RepID=UPI0007003877|nr:PepSY domain-containing protein [Rhizobium sp. Root708]KRB62918.1 hypothetical protein ASE04_01720 [Rhizobium sp. Root708]